ncbi:HEAT repeat domain-containing protein [Polyangium jinanense]|uniref:HEAT repeat domain-containing protein n=1 Tax=Polyangium jinanense TaxID=2829994 RepID=A0A9X4AVG8_9BACT|nr:HEAT repeat domain-containing protein [Polyangium jinanense]MDC3959863.1 HEAT repeat domain-containing protein [Polyangium jinanense]MDC3986314.1 HEAT repeat domain-containing protein [Polyangium jinanense]
MPNLTFSRRTSPLVLLALLALAACGGSPAPDVAAATPPPPPAATPAPALPVTAAPTASAAAPAPPAPPPAPAPVLKGVDVYGTKKFDGAWVRTRFGETFQRWFDTEDEALTKKLEKEMVDGILAEHKDIGWVQLSPVTYYNMGDVPQGYVTVDVVERKDMKKRLTFGPEPKGDFEDPAGLLAAWKEYESTFFRMMREKQIGPERVACPAFHCMGGYVHEKLAPYGEKFVKDVPPNEDKLIKILKEDKDPKDRAAAAFLLAHIKDGKKLVGLMLPLLDDPDALVRNNATRVLVNVAMFHHDVAVPLTPVLKNLNGPTMSDRNKAAAVTFGLVDRPDGAKLYAQVIKEAGPTLIALLELEQPNNHDFAYKILKKVSGKDFGGRDDAAWRKWLASPRG